MSAFFCGRVPMSRIPHHCAPNRFRLTRERLRCLVAVCRRRFENRSRREDSGFHRVSAIPFTGLLILLFVSLSGCGKTTSTAATEQLVLSDAVDRSVGRIDFMPLAGRRCYLDSTNLSTGKTTSFVNVPYVVSSLRNQLISAGCLLVETRTDAEIVLEPRLGALGTDAHEVSYGVPSNNLLTQAASVMPAAPPVPTIPEMSFARKNDQTGAAKVFVFAYNAETGKRIWQSGLSVARSTAQESWYFGVGPFQSGSVFESPRFVGARLKVPLVGEREFSTNTKQVVSLNERYLFEDPQAVVAVVPEPVEPPPAVPSAEEPQTATTESDTRTK
jgi:hypothetical protein